MSAIVVIGDELHCVGFHLAGVQTRSPAPADLDAEFTRTLATASLVVLSRCSANALAPQALQRALAGESPLVVVMPDITGPQVDSGMVQRVRAALGIEG